MAVADVYTYGLLNRWQAIMQENEFAFNQLTRPGAPLSGSCESYIQPERDQIADALVNAVSAAVEYLGYYPRPVWVTERVRLGAGLPVGLQRFKLRHGYIESVGSRATTLIQADAAVSFSDVDGDGVNDTATVIVSTSVSAGEIALFFRVADGAPGAADERWEIETTSVSVSGGTATIRARRALFVKPGLWAVPYKGVNFVEKNIGSSGNSSTDFVTQVDVYRVYTDPANAVTFLSDPLLTCDDTALGTFLSDAGVVLITDARRGEVRVRTPDGYLPCGRCPEYLDIAYRAGLPLTNGKMNRTLETALVRLANTLIPQKPSTLCDRTLEMWDYDRESMPGDLLRPSEIANPFGIMRGQIEAWRVIERMSLGKGGAL